ncbi:anti-sigma F factor [Caproiciproducens sp. LBM24188]|nr:anti-sigma F factor [Oscillospiraceae bacterium]HHV31164.1 anti-sigma F factor [Clostridiales bacterium]
MKPMNEMSLAFPSSSSNESFARAAVAAFVAQLDPTIDELSDIKTAVSEAVTNCIVHAYRNTIGTVYISCKLYENGKITIRIRDKGCGIEDVKQAMQPLFTTAGGERAGLGFAVMESFMDVLRVTSKVGVGTVVTMHKTIERRSKVSVKGKMAEE